MTDKTVETVSYTGNTTPNRIVKRFKNKRKMDKFTLKMAEQGYAMIEQREVKEWHVGKASCLALIFLPLLFMKTKMIEVTYEKK